MSDSGPESASEDETAATPAPVPQAIPAFESGDAGAIAVGWDGRVQVAYLHSHEVSHSWHSSMMNLLTYDKAAGYNLIGSAPFQVFCSGPHSLVEGRNMAVQHFLDNTPHEWLFWVDTDMGFLPQSLDMLFESAHPDDRPIVGGLCFAAKNTGPDGMGGFVIKPLPTMFGMAKDPQGRRGFVNMSRYAPGLNQVAGTGSAFILIHRSVLEVIRLQNGDNWYTPVAYEDGQPISEDLSFCYRANQAGFPVHVNTDVATTHHKDIWVSRHMYQMPEVDPIFGEAPDEAAG